jgi:putative ABC transport system substrate-binding protein
MKRRVFIAGAVAVLAAPLAAGAQQAVKVYRIASFSAQLPTNPQGQGPFYDRMRELGWVHGQNFIVERRAYGDQIERIPDLAAELMRSGVDIFIVGGSVEARPLQQVTRTIPIVAGGAGDLVEAGLAASLARPGGKVTGVQTLMPEVASKHLALLKEITPGLSRSGVLIDVLRTGEYVRTAEASGKALNIRLQIVTVPRVEDFDAAFSAFRAGRAQGLLIVRSPFIIAHQKTIAALALKHRIPTISDLLGFVRDGGLVSYGFDGREASRLLAETIDQILRGAKASEVPIRQVTTFGLSITLKTAKALGLTIPPSLLQRADQVIE